MNLTGDIEVSARGGLVSCTVAIVLVGKLVEPGAGQSPGNRVAGHAVRRQV